MECTRRKRTWRIFRPVENILHRAATPRRQTFNNLTAPELSDEVPIPDGLEVYSYDVTLNYNGTSMPPVTSNIWRLGSVKLPWSTEFNAENALDLFTRIDVNGDKNEWYREWEWYIEATDELVAAVAYPYSSTNPADDWLITPPFMLETRENLHTRIRSHGNERKRPGTHGGLLR